MLQREFDLYLDRARHFYKRLADELFFETVPMEAEFRHCADPVPYAKRIEGEYRPIREGERWGGPWDSGWFRLTAEVRLGRKTGRACGQPERRSAAFPGRSAVFRLLRRLGVRRELPQGDLPAAV